ncbi:MAG: flagellar hook-length control protein FliK, partial [Betaproteobacteria bacterium]
DKEGTPEARPAEHSSDAASITAQPPAVAPAHSAHGEALAVLASPAHAAPVAQAALLQAPQTATPTPAPTVHMALPGPVGTPLWREEFAASVNLLTTQGVASAELRVQPAELGPVQVSIRIEGGEASIACSAQHAQTRQALEDALPRLREILESNGISVGNASVGAHPQNGGAAGDPAWSQGRAQAPSGRLLEVAAVDSQAFAAAQSTRAYARSDRLLDVFA